MGQTPPQNGLPGFAPAIDFSLLSFQIAADGEVPTPEAVDRILKGIS